MARMCVVAMFPLLVVAVLGVTLADQDSAGSCPRPGTEGAEPACSGQRETLPCPDPYFPLGDTCYWIPDARRQMEDGHVYCAVREPDGYTARLAVLDDCDKLAAVANYIADTLDTKTSYWIGGTDLFEEDHWFWLNKAKVVRGAPFWETGQPNGHTKENHLVLNHHGRLEDRDASDLLPFICQLK
nr:C-type lectin BML-2-like [Procambarus clarkii]